MTDNSRPVRAVAIPAGTEEPVAAEQIDGSRAGLAAAVGGQPEIVPLGDRLGLVVDAYGKSRDLGANPRATRFVDSYRRGFSRVDMVAGKALVIGFDDDGRPADAPAEAEQQALRA